MAWQIDSDKYKKIKSLTDMNKLKATVKITDCVINWDNYLFMPLEIEKEKTQVIKRLIRWLKNDKIATLCYRSRYIIIMRY